MYKVHDCQRQSAMTFTKPQRPDQLLESSPKNNNLLVKKRTELGTGGAFLRTIHCPRSFLADKRNQTDLAGARNGGPDLVSAQQVDRSNRRTERYRREPTS